MLRIGAHSGSSFQSFVAATLSYALYARGCGENETHYNIFIGQCDLYLHGYRHYSIFVDYTRVISVLWVNSKILFILFCRSNCVDLLTSGCG